jgi:hypothetical protein
MHTALIGLAAGEAIFGAVTLAGREQPRFSSSTYTPPSAVAPGEDGAVQRVRSAKLTVGPDMTWAQLFEAAGKAAHLPVFVYWNQLRGLHEEPYVQENDVLMVRFTDFTVPEAIALLNDHLNLTEDDGIAWRVLEGKLVIASVEFFDRRELVLVTYDLSGMIERLYGLGAPDVGQAPNAYERHNQIISHKTLTDQAMQEIVQLVMNLIRPQLWQDRGGNAASIRPFGSKLFITMPKRMAPEVEWLLSELPGAIESQAKVERQPTIAGGPSSPAR